MVAEIIKDKCYRLIDVWRKKNDDCAVRYRCFEILGENIFFVQSTDYFFHPINDRHIKNLDKQLIELFLETPPDSRTEGYSTLQEAIDMHEREFEDFSTIIP